MTHWFAEKGWRPRDYQLVMMAAFQQRQSTLLIAPTGGGKTLSGFLGSLLEIHEAAHAAPGSRAGAGGGCLHTLYISPLKALTHDIERNLMQPVAEMGLQVSIESRTGDTPSHKRQRQRRRPPDILLITPESLMLMLSYAEAPRLFHTLQCVIVDEVHSFAHNKRGDLTALALARLERLAPGYCRFGLSATVADPLDLATWLGPSGAPAALLKAEDAPLPDIRLLHAGQRMPYGGFMARYAIAEIYEAIQQAGTTLVFVNTRAQSELLFQLLWDANRDGLPIAIYHGSLSKEQRRKTERLMAENRLRAVVATSALELGIDWGDIDLVIQIGAPKGVSRLLQRIGRSNHRLDAASRALLVPANRFEALECMSAITAVAHGARDGEPRLPGARDIIPQYLMNRACSAPFEAQEVLTEIRSAAPYAALSRAEFDQLLRFTVDGGYALQHYERYQRLVQTDDGHYAAAARAIVQRHRQNIGVIVEAPRLKVKRLNKGRGGRIIGEVEEYFAQGLSPGDTFLFSGEVLAFVSIRDLILEARPAPASEPKIPAYVGGQMPLSTFLADGVRALLDAYDRGGWTGADLPADVHEWLALQQRFSRLPDAHHLLVEHFPHRKRHYTLYYTFEGRKANQTLGMLITRRMERLGLKPLSFSVTDYGLSISSLVPLEAAYITQLLRPDLLGDDLEEWMAESPMLKRAFRQVATVAGLTEQRLAGTRKTMKQVTFSTDLIYDVLRKHEPGHILLALTRAEAERELLDLKRLSDVLGRFNGRVIFQPLGRASPMAIPILLDVRSEQVRGAGVESLLEQASLQEQADAMMEAVRDAVR